MNDIEIIKAVAELDGKRTWVTIDAMGHPIPKPYWWQHPDCDKYLTSYDAIVPVIEKQDEWTQYHFVEMLQDTTEEISVIKLFLATPRQLCEALLRATGKWKE